MEIQFNTNEMQGYKRMVASTLQQAARDWQKLVRAKAWTKPKLSKNVFQKSAVSLDELRAFFQSELCEEMCLFINLDRKKIFEQLEAEYSRAYAKWEAQQKRLNGE